MTEVQNLKELNQQVLSEPVVFVDFWAEWCQSCKAMMPTIQNLEHGYNGQVKFLKCNVEEAQDVAIAFGVSSLPTLLMFKNGKVFNKLSSSASRSRLTDFVESAL